jgi:hypothetical protein
MDINWLRKDIFQTKTLGDAYQLDGGLSKTSVKRGLNCLIFLYLFYSKFFFKQIVFVSFVGGGGGARPVRPAPFFTRN